MSAPFTCPRCGAVSHHPDDLTNGYCGRCHDWTALTPGAWSDTAGTLHVDVGVMLSAAGYADTPANRETLTAAAAELAHMIGAELDVQQ